jgi:uncharacterized protein (TIGR02001 family)
MKGTGAAFIILLAADSAAAAETENSLSGTLTLTSDYRFRGISQDDGQITPQAELDWSGPDGWSAGAFASKVDFNDRENTSFELDLFGGRRIELGWGVLDLEAIYYGYPDHHPSKGSRTYSSWELSGKLTHDWDAWSGSLAISWSPDFVGNGAAWDVEAGAARDITSWLAVSGHAGRQWIDRWDRLAHIGFPYSYADIGATATRGRFSLDLRYEVTTLSKTQCLLTEGAPDWCNGGFVLTLTYALGKDG